MLPISEADSLKLRVEQLVGRRRPLSAQFEKNPSDTHLAVELRIIDDQIAECNQQLQTDRKNRK